MTTTYDKNLEGKDLRIAIVCARFNEVVTEKLLQGAVETLAERGVNDETIEIARVPGAFEIPLITEHFARSGRFDAIVCLGAVIRGETAHFDFISDFVVNEAGKIMVRHGLPIALGVLTPNTVEQGLARAGGQHGNKGKEAAETALEMANLIRTVRGED